MAKSIRSKWRRKCRAVKRERYGAKELDRLKKTLGIDESAQGDVNMTELSKIATVTDAATITESVKAKADAEGAALEEMDQDGKRVYDKKTFLDQHGNYPPWMSKRKITKHKKGRAKSKKATMKQDRRLTRKQKKSLKNKETAQS